MEPMDIPGASEEKIKDFQQSIALNFERFKEDLNSQEYPNVNDLMLTVNQKSEELQYQINQSVQDNLGWKNSFEGKKMEYLIQLQNLTSSITYHVLSALKSKAECKDNK